MLNRCDSSDKQTKASHTSNNFCVRKIIENRHFCFYENRKKRDIEEEDHSKKFELMKSIYNKSFQEKVNPQYQKVEKYV